MTKNYNNCMLVLFFSLSISYANAQQIIDSVKVIPSNPTTADSIYVITYVTMATTANGYLGYDLSTSGEIINIESCYKHGMLDAPQTYIDTINMGLKPIGVYTLNFTAYSTYFIPCDYSDTFNLQMNFIVSAPLEINEAACEFTFRLFPNPFSESTTLHVDPIYFGETFYISNQLGEIVKVIQINSETILLDRENLPNGIYFFSLGNQQGKFVIQ